MSKDFLKNAMRQCSQLREDKTCKFKDEPSKRQCELDVCCAMCDKAEGECKSEVGICTYLY
jgi:hypothetical protein